MDINDKKKSLDDLSIAELKIRLAVVTKVIRGAQAEGNGRWENVIAQQRRLNEALVKKIKALRRKRGEPEPNSVTIGIKPVRVASKRIGM